MPEILQLGPLAIRTEWMLLAISGAGGYMVMKQWFKRSLYREQPCWDAFFNAFLIAFLAWKCSPVLWHPSLIWNNPLLLLVTPGTSLGWGLGLAGGLFYMDRSLRRMRIPRLFFNDLLSLGLAAAVIVYCLLRWQYGSSTGLPWGIALEDPEYKYHPLNVYTLAVTLPVFIRLLRQRTSLGSGKMTANFLTFYGMGLMAVSLFRVEMYDVFIGLSASQWLYLAMMISGFAMRMRLP